MTGPPPGSVAAAFRNWTGAPPEGVWRAPGRVNLIGEHLDYNGGHVLPFAIDRAVQVAVRRTPGRALRIRSVQYGRPVEIGLDELAATTGWAAYVAGVVWALGEVGAPPQAMDILVDSSLPQGRGLSSSAALECATALAVADLAGLPAGTDEDRLRLALVAQRAESEVAGVPVGVMDQAVSMVARAGHALHLDTRTLVAEHLPLGCGGDGMHLLAVDTGTPHRLADDPYARRRRECAAAAVALGVAWLTDAAPSQLSSVPGLAGAVLRRARHVISEEARTEEAAAALAAGQIDRLGPLMTASHISLRDDFECSTEALDAVVAAALGAGAAGARMTGAGWGGTAVVLAPSAAVPAVTSAVTAALRARGVPSPGALRLAAAGGANRVA